MTLDHAFGISLAFLIDDAENERTSNSMNESSSFFHTLFLLLFHPAFRPSIFLPSSFFHQPLPPPVRPSCSTLRFPAIVILQSTSSSSRSPVRPSCSTLRFPAQYCRGVRWSVEQDGILRTSSSTSTGRHLLSTLLCGKFMIHYYTHRAPVHTFFTYLTTILFPSFTDRSLHF